jgi:uncharacterized repeat protein (TIGR02543 family)
MLYYGDTFNDNLILIMDLHYISAVLCQHFKKSVLKNTVIVFSFLSFFVFAQAAFAAPRIDYKTGFYDISTASFDSVVLSVSAQESSVQDMIYNNTGTRLFVMGSNGRDINQYNLTTPYDISTAAFSAVVLDVSAQESTPTGFLFNNTGTRLYVIGASGDAIDQYNLGTAYNVATAVFSSQILSVSAQETFPSDMLFNNNGTKLYVLGSDDDQVNEYNLGTAYDISTATFDSVALSVSGQELVPNEMMFNSDGTKLYVTGATGDDVNQYNLSTPYDIGTGVFAGIATSVASQDGVPRAMLFNENGSKFYLMGSSGNDVNQYTLETPNSSFIEVFANDGGVTGELGFTLSGDTFNDSDNNGLLTSCGGAVACAGHQVQVVNLPAGFTPTVSLYKADGTTSNTTDNAPIGVLTLTGSATSHQNVHDLSTLTFTFSNSAFNTSTAASVTNAVAASATTGIDFLDNPVPEIDYTLGLYNTQTAVFTSIALSVAAQELTPSAMLFNNTGTRLYVMGTGGTDINQYNLGTPYDVSTGVFSTIALSVSGQEAAPTSMLFNNTGTRLYVMGTSGDDVNQYNLGTAYDISTATFNSIALSVSAQEGSPQSMVFNHNGTKLYVMGVLGQDINQYNLTTAYDISTATFDSIALSVSGQEASPNEIIFNHDGKRMYLVGSGSDAVYEYALSTAYDITTASARSSFSVGGQEVTSTSLLFNNAGTKLYVMGTTGDDINQYTLEQPNTSFVEAGANDGSVTGQLGFTLSYDTFNDPNTDGVLTACGGAVACAGHQVHITNLPAGLTPTVTLYNNNGTTTNTSDTAPVGILTLTGNATSHQNVNDVVNLVFTFANSAFNSTAAASVTNAVAASASTGINFLDNAGTYTVTYDGNTNTGGSVPIDASSPYSTASTVTVLGNTGSLVKAGYSFNGWNTLANGSGTSYAPAATFSITADTTLFAQWSLAPGITVTMVDNLTSETGATGSFTIVLDSAPTANVTIALSSTDTGEGTVPASVTFTTLNWNTPQAVTVTGVDDVTSDGSQNFTVITGDVTSADLTYNVLDGSTIGDLVFSNQDDDAPGIVLTPLSTNTTEAGGTVSVEVTLLAQPAGGADVTIPLSVSDATEGSVPASITILNANWNIGASNVITVTGVDDGVVDGNIVYSLVTGDPTSADPAYDAFTATDVSDVSLTNIDNEVTTYTVTYDGNASTGGSVPVDASSPYTPSATVTVLGNTGALVQAGSTFNNWNTEADGSGTAYAPAATFTITGDTVLYAQWTLVLANYTVTYNGNTNTGGIVPVDASSPYSTGSTVTVLGNTGALVKAGSTFDNWNTAANGSGIDYAPADTFTITTNTTLFALWSDTTAPSDPVVGTITPNPANEGDVVTLSLTSVEPGATVTIPGFSCVPTPADGTGNVTCTAIAGSGYDGTAQTITVIDAASNANTNTQSPAIVINAGSSSGGSGGGGVRRICTDPKALNYSGANAKGKSVSSFCKYANDATENGTSLSLIGGGEPNVPAEFDSYVCKRYLRDYIFVGNDNNPEEVKKLQEFLNEQGEKLAVDGSYDADDIAAVKRFQEKYRDQILSPWGLTGATGVVGRTTTAKINLMSCAHNTQCPYFTQNLQPGEESIQAVKVQDFLNIIFAPTSGYPTQGIDLSKQMTEETVASVREYQTVYKESVLKPLGLTSSTGWWYEKSRAAANKLMNCTP